MRRLGSSHSLGTVFTTILAITAFTNPARAVTLTSLKGQGLEAVYGTYASGGDCSRMEQITIGPDGFIFKSRERLARSRRFEYAVSYLGPEYSGISAVFFPFPINDDNFGSLVLTINDNERRGVISLSSEKPKDQTRSQFPDSMAASSPFVLCTTRRVATVAAPSAAVASNPGESKAQVADWTNLSALVGRLPGTGADNFDLFAEGAVAKELAVRLGPRLRVLQRNLSVSAPLQRRGPYYWLTGNAPHRGGVDQAYLVFEATHRQIQIGLWERGRLVVYAPRSGRMPLPPAIREWLAESRGKDAVPLPRLRQQ